MSEIKSNTKITSLEEFKLKYVPYKHDNYLNFVRDSNIFNNDILSEENLNRAVNVLKKESLNSWAIIQILQSKLINKWHPKETYKPGEFVYWPGLEVEEKKQKEFGNVEDVLKYTEAEINNMYYVAVHKEHIYDTKTGLNIPNENKAKDPSQYIGTYWLPITKYHLLPDFDLSSCVKYLEEDNKRNGNVWRITKPGDAVNKEYVDTNIEKLNKNIDIFFVKKDNKEELNYDNPNSLVRKTHLDKLELDLKGGKITPSKAGGLVTPNGEVLDYTEFVRCVGGERKLIFRNDSISHMTTPDKGFKPGKNYNKNTGEGTDLGTEVETFRTIYSQEFYGTALRARYADLAEKYETDLNYSFGIVLGLKNGIGTLYKKGMKLLGVIAQNPALRLNEESKGQFITLKGLTPVRISNKANLDDYVIADDNGLGKAVKDYNFEESKRLIGVVIKILEDNLVLVKI